jgi:hypothetical protein
MSLSPNRIIYAGTTVLVSDSPASKDHTDDYSLKLLNRIQSSSVSVSSPTEKKKQIGFGEYLYNVNLLPPIVNCEINYINQNNSNELLLGLNASGEYIYKGLEETGVDKNLFFLFYTGSDGKDVNSLPQYTGVQVLGFGNALITNYSTSASVGGLPSSSVSFVGNNIVFQNYDENQIIPSLTQSGQITNYTYNISSEIFDRSNYLSDSGDDLQFLRAGDIILNLEDSTTGIGGTKFITSGKIQNYDIQIPFERKDLVGFGSDYPFERKLMYPTIGTLSMSVIFDGFNTGNQTGVVFQNKLYDFNIDLYDCSGNKKLTYGIEGARIVSQNMQSQIGPSFVFEGSFEFSIGVDHGFYISGASQFI